MTSLAAALPAQTLDDLRDQLRDAARGSRYSLFAAGFSSFTEETELSGGRFRIDAPADEPSLELKVVTLPLHREWEMGERRWLAEFGVGRATASYDVPNLWAGSDPGIATRADAEYEALGAIASAGPTFDCGGGVECAVLGAFGIAHVESDARYSGPGSAVSSALLDGIVFNWDVTYAVYGATVLLRHEGWNWGEVRVVPQLRYELRVFDPLQVDDVAQDERNTMHSAVARIGWEGATGWVVRGGGVRWVADVGGKLFDRQTADALEFGGYVEFGAGLRWDAVDRLPLLSAVGLDGAVFVGDDLFGWTVGFSCAF